MTLDELRCLPDDSQDEILIDNLEKLSYEVVVDGLIPELLRVLKDCGTVEFACADFLKAVNRYVDLNGTDRGFSQRLFVNGPVFSLWDERSVARVFLLGGFAKVHTGTVAHLPDTMFYVRAIKYTTPIMVR